jgi:hypothetical protein
MNLIFLLVCKQFFSFNNQVWSYNVHYLPWAKRSGRTMFIIYRGRKIASSVAYILFTFRDGEEVLFRSMSRLASLNEALLGEVATLADRG